MRFSNNKKQSIFHRSQQSNRIYKTAKYEYSSSSTGGQQQQQQQQNSYSSIGNDRNGNLNEINKLDTLLNDLEKERTATLDRSELKKNCLE